MKEYQFTFRAIVYTLSYKEGIDSEEPASL